MNKISVVVPVYNAGDSIKMCIDSIIESDFYDYEILLVDDCSTDSTLSIMKDYIDEKKNQDKIKVISSPRNGRAGAARNIGVLNSDSEYIFFLDQDDCITKDALRKLYELSRGGKIDVVAGAIEEVSGVIERRIKTSSCEIGDDVRSDLICNFGYVFGMLIKRSLLTDYKLKFVENVTFEDTLFPATLFIYANSYQCTDAIVIKRHGMDTSQTSHMDASCSVDRYQSAKWYLDRIPAESKWYQICVQHFIYYSYVSTILLSNRISDKKYILCGKKCISQFGFDAEKFSCVYKRYKDKKIIKLADKIYYDDNYILFPYLFKQMLKRKIFLVLYFVYRITGIRDLRRTILGVKIENEQNRQV